MARPIQCFWLCILLCGLVTRSAISQAPTHPQATVDAKASVQALPAGSTAAVAVVLNVPEGLHAQSAKPLAENLIGLQITPKPADLVAWGDVVYPEGKIVEYPLLGRLSVNEGSIVSFVPFSVAADAPPGPLTLRGTVRYQLCDDASCFIPKTVPFEVTVRITPAGTDDVPANAELFAGFKPPTRIAAPDESVSVAPPPTAPEPLPAGSRTAETSPAKVPAGEASLSGTPANSATGVSLFGYRFDLRERGLWATLALALGVGVIFNVMPCVLPVLPLKAVGFYEASHHNRRRTLMFGLSFAAGMIAVFFLLAIVVLMGRSIFGRDFQWGQQFSYGWFVWGMAILLGLLGIGLMGAFTFNLPTGVYGLDFRHDTMGGNFLWGGLTAVLSTPCTAPLFPPILAWAIGQPLILGMAAVVTVGIGMALPYVLLSAFPELARRFPRTGPASELVKQMMGFMLLGSAAFFAGIRLLEPPNHWWLVFAVTCWAAVYLVVRTPQLTQKPLSLYLATGFAVALVGGSLLATIRLTGWSGPSVAGGAADTQTLWTPYSSEALESARQQNRTVLVKFTAAWCLNCQYVEQTVFKDPAALKALRERDVVLLKSDLTDSDAPGWALLEKLGQSGIPFTAIYRPDEPEPRTLASIYTTASLIDALPPVPAAGSDTDGVSVVR